jgi:hypothetical protein
MKQNSDPSSLCEKGPGEIPLLPAALWMGSYLIALLLQKYVALSPGMQVAVALIPVAPFAFFVFRFIAHLRNLDELQRRVHFEALAFAFPLAMLLLMTLGLMERGHLLSAKHWSYGDVWFYLPLFYLIGIAISWRRYR